MSLYADYIKEKMNDEIIEHEHAFATYRYLNESQVYIVDIYVDFEFRKSRYASELADQIAVKAKARGCKEMLGSVVPVTRNSDDSMRVLLAYGMKPFAIDGNMVLFKKEL